MKLIVGENRKPAGGLKRFCRFRKHVLSIKLSIQANGNASATGKPKTNHCNIAPNVPGTRSPEVSSGTSSGCTYQGNTVEEIYYPIYQ
jgi:hypothetical protein